ncbi:hypothetical protein F2Q70_00043435 [Brassica cretica]|uniref:Uncharacterized protein n=1 Tax=Brassica cretica TaxID=69181 RepID=A0A8S9KC04_BRACR|nr:hypothetical protein F2Q70_00043435 [Brassica cretica]
MLQPPSPPSQSFSHRMLSSSTLTSICCPRHRHHSLSLPSSTARYHQVIKPSRSATIIRSCASLIRLNTEREDRGDLSVGEVCVGIEGSGGGNERLSGGNERLGGGGGDELRGGVRKKVSENASAAITTFTKLQPPYAVLLHPRHHLLSSPPSSLSLSLCHRQQHDITKSSNHHAQPPLSRASLIRLNTEREDRGDLSGGEVCVEIEGSGGGNERLSGGNERLSGGNERLGGGGGDELRGGVQKQVSETWYLTKLSVYDNNDHASFVLLGDAGRELTGMKASELVESYFEANESVGDDHVAPVPQSLTDSIGQTRTFIIKVSKHNLDGKTQSLTVTKVLPLEVPALEGNIDEDVEEEPADEKDGAADGTVKRNSDGIESGETKRAKCD